MMVDDKRDKPQADISTMFPIESMGLLETMALGNLAKDLGTIASLFLVSSINGTSLN